MHYTIDADSRIITDCFATTGAKHEYTVLSDRVDFHINHLGFKPLEWIADRGYGRGPTYAHLRNYKIKSYIPLYEDNLGEGRLTRGDFTYDRKNDRFICPAGHLMYPYDKLHNGISKQYRIIGKYCGAYPLKKGCLPKNYNKRSRFMFRSPYQDEIDKVKKRQKNSHFKNKLYERQWKIEGFLWKQKNHGLRRSKYRGIQKFQIQCYMTALVQNIKRLIHLILLFLYIFYEKNEIENNIYSFFKYIKFLNKSGVCSQLQIDSM